ncbi:MAG TPA: hypothetical protein VFA45_20705 [Actinomycetes bacterium]|nr:hypothetical protein [Actinomycetes bacterium]
MARRIYRVIEAPEVERRLRVVPAELIDLWLTVVHQVLTLDPVTEGGPHQITYIRDAAAYRLQAEAASGGRVYVYYEALEDERVVLIVDFEWWPARR